MRADQVLDAVEKSAAFKTGPHLLLREVRNGTGFKRSERYADGLLVSLWPSRGVWFAGIEVKVSRSDWLSELKNPAKSAEIQRWCRYWWLITAPGIAKPEEIPETWGWAEVSEAGRLKTLKAAPVLEPESPTVDFVASILRNRAAVEDALVTKARAAARKETIESSSVVDERELESLRLNLSKAESENKRLHGFLADAGLSLSSQPKIDAQAYQLARRIVTDSTRWNASTPAGLRRLADSIDEIELARLNVNQEARATVGALVGDLTNTDGVAQ